MDVDVRQKIRHLFPRHSSPDVVPGFKVFCVGRVTLQTGCIVGGFSD